MAHIDAGKTTTTERGSFITPASPTRSAKSMTATPPWTGWSRSRSAASPSPRPRPRAHRWNDHRVNIIDTPGHVDFTIEVERSLRVLDGAVAVFDSVAGVEPQSETVWRQADKYGVPRICFVNKMDRIGADFYRCVDMIVDRLGATPLVMQLPVGAEADYSGVIDLIKMKAIVWKGEDLGAAFEDGRYPRRTRRQGRGPIASHDRAGRRAGRRRHGGLSGRHRAGREDADPPASARAPSRAPSCRS